MKTIFRLLVLTLSITALTTTIANAMVTGNEDSDIVSPQITTSTLSNITPEVIPKSSVSVELGFKNKTIISILQSIGQLTHSTTTKIYSLLNWKHHTRDNDLEVVSYNRINQFGKWVHDKKDSTDCYNTRAKVLIRDSSKTIVFNADNACSVEKGEWVDPYAGKVLTDAKLDIQIDHMVPLKNAYVSGAYAWDYKTRCLYGNYLGANFHLISVAGVENQRKGDKGPDGYMPSNISYTCTYLKNWLTIKTLWNLTMTPDEATAIKKLISSEGCHVEKFVLSEKDILAQRKFAFEHSNLCADKK
ncbi:MAG: DUF1524 domain-containing protein [Pseudobdellovibrio sp.]